MSDTISVEGKEFSVETVKAALNKHCNFESDLLKGMQVDCFVAVNTKDGSSCPYLLGSVKYCDTKWDRDHPESDDKRHINYYEKGEIAEIITGLQNLIKD